MIKHLIIQPNQYNQYHLDRGKEYLAHLDNYIFENGLDRNEFAFVQIGNYINVPFQSIDLLEVFRKYPIRLNLMEMVSHLRKVMIHGMGMDLSKIETINVFMGDTSHNIGYEERCFSEFVSWKNLNGITLKEHFNKELSLSCGMNWTTNFMTLVVIDYVIGYIYPEPEMGYMRDHYGKLKINNFLFDGHAFKFNNLYSTNVKVNQFEMTPRHPDDSYLSVYSRERKVEFNVNYTDMTRSYALNMKKKYDDITKDMELAFGMSNLFHNTDIYVKRKQVLDVLLTKLFGRGERFFVSYKHNDGFYGDSPTTADEYLRKIARSKMTFIVPAYHEECFSMSRILEAGNLGCIPVPLFEFPIADGMKFQDTFELLNVLHLDFFNFIRECSGDLEEAIEMMNTGYDEILEGLLNTSLFTDPIDYSDMHKAFGAK